MSADNYVAVQEIQGRWYVWNESASNEIPIVPLNRARRFRFRFLAMRYARKRVREDYYEYGLRELGGYDEWRDYYQDAVDRLQRDYWETVDGFQKRASQEVH